MIHKFRRVVMGLVLLASIGALAEELRVGSPGERRSGWKFEEFGNTPVHLGGRLKPLDTMAQETALFVTGSRKFLGFEPVELLLSWITAPGVWEERAFIQVSREDLRKQLGLDLTRTRFSPRELIHSSYLGQYMDRLSGSGANALSKPPIVGGAPKQDPREKELTQLVDRIGTYRSIVSGQGWPLIPRPAPQAWGVLLGIDSEGSAIRNTMAEVVKAYASESQGEFDSQSARLRQQVRALAGNLSDSEERLIRLETFYNHSRPFLLAWICYLLASIAWVFSIGWASARNPKLLAGKEEPSSPVERGLKGIALLATAAGFAIHVGGMVLRGWISGRPPVTNMYESLIWVAFGVVFFGAVLYWRQRQGVIVASATFVSTFLLIVADAAPALMDPSIHPLVPVLRSNTWLTIHVLTITLGYSAFALTLGLGNVTLYQFLRPGAGLNARITNLNQLTYRAMQFGVVLLAAGTLLGGVWADYSWGRFWGWDPKEVWALIALLGYIALLHARYVGWVQQFGFAAWSVLSFMLVVMAWYGVNFVLGVGLHSYGFSTGGRGWVAAFCLAQSSYVALCAILRRRRKAGVA